MEKGFLPDVFFLCYQGSFNVTSASSTLQSIPGFDNTFTPSAGTDGLRLNIHEPGTVPNPSFQVWDYFGQEYFY